MYQIPFGRVILPTVHTELRCEGTCETCNSPMAPNVDNLLKWIMGEMKKRFLVKAVP